MSRPRLIALLLALVTLMVYLPVTGFDFLVFDDNGYITDNQLVQRGLSWQGISWAFTTFHMANWHPITWISHLADCELFHLNAGAHHFVNVLFHAVNTALLFALLWRLTARLWPAALVAGLFAWHPLHIESVAWVSERKDVLSTFFALLALLSYARYAKEKRRLDFWLSCLWFALGIMSKPMLVTLPFVLLLLDFWPLGRASAAKIRQAEIKPLVWEKVPFFIITIVSCILTFLAQRAGNAVVPLDKFSMEGRFINATVAYMRYLLKLFWPADLAVVYPPLPIARETFILALGTLALISVAVWLARRHQPFWLFGWCWFLGTLVPVIGLVQVGGAAMADRYTYLPSIGIFIAVAYGGYGFTRFKWLYPIAAPLVLIACMVLTERQLPYWRDTETLFRRTLAITRHNELAHINLGYALENQGRQAEALEEFRQAMRINPAHFQVRYAIGNVLVKLGRPAEAMEEFRRCLDQTPDVPMLHHAAGTALAAQGDTAAALGEYAEAARLNPYYPPPRIDAAKIYLAQNQPTRARDELQAAVKAAPNDILTLVAVARCLAASTNAAVRDGHAALALALKANELAGEKDPGVYDVLGMAFAATGDFANAIISAQNALEFAPAARLKDTAPIQQRLELYQNRQPWMDPASDPDPAGKNNAG